MNSTLGRMQGKHGRSPSAAVPFVQRYERAKRKFDMSAATDIVDEIVDMRVVDSIIDRLLIANKPAIIALPHPEYDSASLDNPSMPTPSNALPFAFAERLATELGCEIDTDIYEAARPGRTLLKTFPRFLWQPKFAGAVRPDRAYILADDVCTMCGTLAMLRSHIVANGGTVIAVSTLARTNGGHVRFPISEKTVKALLSAFGDGLSELWLREVGHEPGCLTEAEGQALLRWFAENCARERERSSALQRLRDRLVEAAAKAG